MSSSDVTLPPIATASAHGSEAGDDGAVPSAPPAAAVAAERPSGRRSVKAKFVGVTATNVRRGVPPPAPHTQLVHSLQLDPYNAYFGRSVPVPPTLLAAAATAAAEADKQRKKLGRPRAGTASSGPLQPPSASVSTTPSGSLSARTAPVAGRRAGANASAVATSGAATARTAVVVPRARGGVTQRPVGTLEEEKSAPPASLNHLQQLPEWLQPRAHAAYPPPQAPLSPVPGAPWTGVEADHVAAAAASGGPSRHPPAITLPSTHSFQFYSPLSAPAERHHCAGAPVHPLAHQYMYAHRQQTPGSGNGRSASRGASRSHSPTRASRAPVGASPLPGGAGDANPEVWSSWPFVNPRLVIAAPTASPGPGTPGGSGSGEEKEPSAAAAATAPGSSSGSGAPPPLPVVPRLFGSVVSAQERTLVFEYLRSTYSRLIQWPPQDEENAAGSEQKQASTPDAGAGASLQQPPLPVVTFTEAQLSRLIEEGRTAAGAIVLLRRLDAELAQATQAGTVGQAARALLPVDAPAALVDAARPRPPPQHYSSAEELVAAVVATRAYLDTLRRELFRWFCARDGGLNLFGAPAPAAASAAAAAAVSAEGAASPKSTVFVTQQMVDALVAASSAAGLSEEELWALLSRWNTGAAGATSAVTAVLPGQQVPRFEGFDELVAAVRAHAEQKRLWGLNPAAGTASASPSPAVAGTGAQGEAGFVPTAVATGSGAAGFAAMAPPLQQQQQAYNTLPLDPLMPQAPVALSPAAARHAASSLSYARLLLFKFLRDDTAAASGASAEEDGRVGSGGGGGAPLFAHAKDVTASMSQMDALIESTRGLTLGQNYHALPPSAAPAAAASSPAAHPRGLGASRPHSTPSAPDGSASSPSRHATRPPSPEPPGASGSPTASANAGTGGSSIAASTRAYGSFLAARTIRVLRALLHQGQSYRSFDELIHASHAHTRKLRMERVKVLLFLTGQQGFNAPPAQDRKKGQGASAAAATTVAAAGAATPSSLASLPASATEGPLTPEQVAALQVLTGSNAAGAGGLFDAYYLDASRRERARLAMEQQRAAQVRLNTHQYGSGSGSGSGHGSSAAQLPHVPQPRRPSIAAPSERTLRAAAGGGGGGGGAKAAPSGKGQLGGSSAPDRSAHRRRPSRHIGVPSHIYHSSAGGGGGHARNASRLETGHFDWALGEPAQPADSSLSAEQSGGGGTDPAAIRAAAQAAAALAANGGVAPLNSSTITRYASAKTLPYTASKSLLLKHGDALAPPGLPSLPGTTVSATATAAAAAGEGDAAAAQQLPPLVVTPELVDALFGGLDHFLTLGSADAATIRPSSSSATGGLGVAAGAFDPLQEQSDEDFLLESEPEDAYNSMDLTLLLRQFKAARSAEDEPLASRLQVQHLSPHQQLHEQPQSSYLSAHPLYKPMLEQAKKHAEDSKSGKASTPSKQQHQQGGGDAGGEEHVFVVRSASRRRASTATMTAPASAPVHVSASSTVAPVAADATLEDPLHPSSSTTIPTLESLLNPQQHQQATPSGAAEPNPTATNTDAMPVASAAPVPLKLVAVESTVTVLRPRGESSGATEASASPTSSPSLDGAASPPEIDAAADLLGAAPVQMHVRAPSGESFLLSPVSPTESSKETADDSAAVLPPQQSPTPGPVLSIAIEAAPSRELVARAYEPLVTLASSPAVGGVGAAPAEGGDPAGLPRMLPVVWQTMQLLRDQGKIKLHNSLSPSSGGAGVGPAGAGTGSALGPFVPHCGPVVPGGSMGSVKTLAILRELSATRPRRTFFSLQALVATVCSMRAERKWAQRAANAEKKKLLAAGITIAQASGLPNEIAAPHILSNYASALPSPSTSSSSGQGPHRRGASTLPSPRVGGASSAYSSAAENSGMISAVQFQLITSPQSLAGRSVRHVTLVDEEAEEEERMRLAHARAEAAAAGGDGEEEEGEQERDAGAGPGLQSGTWGTESQRFLPPSAFPSSLHMPAYPAPPPIGPGGLQQVAVAAVAAAKRHQRDESESFAETEARAWARARLLAHLSTLLLLRPDAPAEGGPAPAPVPLTGSASSHVDVQIRMGELESLLDALSSGPRDATTHAEKLARREREALERVAATSSLGSPSSDAALASLASLPPPGHPLAPLLSLLTALDAAELAFPDMAALVRAVQQGTWPTLIKQAERRKQRATTLQQQQQQQLEMDALDAAGASQP